MLCQRSQASIDTYERGALAYRSIADAGRIGMKIFLNDHV